MNESNNVGWWFGLPAYFMLGPEGLFGHITLTAILVIGFNYKWKSVKLTVVLRTYRPVLMQFFILATVGVLMDLSVQRQLIDEVIIVFILAILCTIYYGFDRSINQTVQTLIVGVQLYLTAVACLLAVTSARKDWL
jgi:hypothetical protein